MKLLLNKSLLVTLMIIVTVIGIYWTWLSHCYVKPFRRVVRGDNEAHVIAVLGKPQYVSTMRDKMKDTWERGDEFTTAGSEIVKTFCYWPPLGVGGHYCVSFDGDGRVVAKGKPPKL